METRFSLLYTAINEKVANEEITLAQAEMLKEDAFNKYVLADDEYISEGVTAKLVAFKKKLKEIRDKKPKEYDGPEEVKKFVDNHYDDIVKASSMLEKEPENLRKDDIKGAVASVLAMIPGMGLYGAGMNKQYKAYDTKLGFNNFDTFGKVIDKKGYHAGIAMAIIGLISTVVVPLIWRILRWVRENADIENINYLSKIRSALKKVDTKKLPEKYRNKITDMVTAIDDAETSVRAKLKVTKESTNTVTDALLSIYEAVVENQISADEKILLINALRQ